jgi:HK97 family phage major capsid protein
MISVNAAGVAHAKNLIAAGKVNKGSWSFSASDGDALLGPKGDDWESFGKYHLAVHTDQQSDTKAHFGYPFGKDGDVYRAGVIAAKSRAAAQGDSAIESAASTLLELIDGKDGASQRASLRTKLPSIHLEKPEALRLRTPQSALERWDPQLAAKSAPAADEGEISILDEIGPDWMGMVSAPMVKDALKRMEGAPVRVVLNSPGGDAFEGVAIYNLLREYPGKVTVHVLGLAASAASVIAMAGDRIEMGEAAFLMIHSAWGMVVGNKKDMQQVASLLDQIDTAIAEVYARRSGQKVADVMTMMEAETWLAPQDAVDKGFADIAMNPPKKKDKPKNSFKNVSHFDHPANQGSLAASGERRSFAVRMSSSPGASGPRGTVLLKGSTVKPSMKEQIASYEAKRAAHMARMDALMELSNQEGRTLTEAEQQEYDGLATDVDTIDGHLQRQRDHEKRMAVSATAVNAKTAGADGHHAADPAAASAQRGAPAREQRDYITVNSRVDKAIPFTRYVRALAMAKGSLTGALAIAQNNKQWQDQTPEVAQVLLAAVAAGDTTTAGWASELVYNQNLVNEFINFLRPMTIIGRIPGLTNVPFNVRVAGATSGTSAGWVGQGFPAAVSKMATNAVTLGIAKAAGIVVLDAELIRSSAPSAELLVRNDLAKAVSQFVDTQFVSPDVAASANVSPASITNGVNPTAATGTTGATLRTDVQTLFNIWIQANLDPSGGVWIMTPTQALAISLMLNALGQSLFQGPGNTINMNGGTFFGLPVVTSQSCQMIGSPVVGEGQMIILLNAPEIMLADDGQVTIDASAEASLQMLDNPTNQSTAASGGPTPTTVVSMFQTNSVALRATRFVNWVKRRPIAVQYIKDAAYVS